MKNYTVSEFTKSMKSLVEGAFSETVAVTGEVSNFSKASSGHIYFVLKDGGAQLRAAFFKRYTMGSGVFVPKNGDKVQAVGDITVYEADGSYQLLVKRVFYDSAGDFWRKFEETKRRLEAEGLFDVLRKRPMPMYPKRVALVTSLSGAAVKDFIVTAGKAGAKFDIEVWGVPVQGAEAAAKIARAVDLAGSLTARYDALVIMRGGGSLEDLAVFNEEIVVRSAASSKVPTVSAVGHERDVTVVDFASDCRLATPTAAAVLLSEGYGKASELASGLNDRLIEAAVGAVQKLYQRLDYAELRLSRSSPGALMKSYENRLAIAGQSLRFAAAERIAALKNRLQRLSFSLEGKSPALVLAAMKAGLDGLERSLKNMVLSEMAAYKRRLETLEEKMGILNPENILGRGYALIIKNGKVVTSVGDVRLKEDIEIKLKDGYINSFVVGKKLEAINGQDTNNS